MKPHGIFNIHVEGQILITTVTGPWNVELVEQWRDLTKPYIKALARTGGGCINIVNSLVCVRQRL
jgi:hypothetical protein